MDWKQALANIDQALSSISANRQTHAALMESVRVIQVEIESGLEAKKKLTETEPPDQHS